MTETVPVIAIDGPSGSGKGTISRNVAGRLGWHYLDSGALYRLVALAGLRAGVDQGDAAEHARLAAALDPSFALDESGEERILLGGKDVTRAIRTEDCGDAASRVAKYPEVRNALIGLQRRFARSPGLVADGRDMGSIVFPTAGLKIFLTASPEERAVRRHKQLKEKGISVSLAALSADIAERDRRDAARDVAPLKPGTDALILDTTEMTIAQVVARVLTLAHERFGEAASAEDSG